MEETDTKKVSMLPYKQRIEMLDDFGKIVIECVRDPALEGAIKLLTGKSANPILTRQYEILKTLTIEQREKVTDLISETISEVIFEFLHIFSDNPDDIKLIVKQDGVEHDYCDLTEHAGSEIVGLDRDDAWQRFSKIGRFLV